MLRGKSDIGASCRYCGDDGWIDGTGQACPCSRTEAARLSADYSPQQHREQADRERRQALLSETASRVPQASAQAFQCADIDAERARWFTTVSVAFGDLSRAMYGASDVQAELAVLKAVAQAWGEAECREAEGG